MVARRKGINGLNSKWQSEIRGKGVGGNYSNSIPSGPLSAGRTLTRLDAFEGALDSPARAALAKDVEAGIPSFLINKRLHLMRAISERDLAVVIPLLAAKIRDLTLELRASQALDGDPTDDEVDDRMQIQETLDQYDSVLDSLRGEYEEGLVEGIRLPTFEELTRRFHVESV